MSDFQFSEIGMNWINGDLEHSAKGTSWEKKNHKYIKKGITKEGKTFYRYDANTKTYTETEVTDEEIGINSVADAVDYKEFVMKYGENMAAHHFLAKKRGIDFVDSKTPILYKQLIEDRLKHSDELMHHGIAGQKWGVQNGPPYPIQPGDHSSAEKKHMDKYDKRKENIDSQVKNNFASIVRTPLNKTIEKKAKKAQKLYNDAVRREAEYLKSTYDTPSVQTVVRGMLKSDANKEYSEKVDNIARKFTGKYADVLVENLPRYKSETHSQVVAELIKEYNNSVYSRKYATDEEHDIYSKEYVKAANKANDYLIKSGYMKGHQEEDYKEVARELYRDDPEYRKLADKEDEYWNKAVSHY